MFLLKITETRSFESEGEFFQMSNKCVDDVRFSFPKKKDLKLKLDICLENKFGSNYFSTKTLEEQQFMFTSSK